MNLLRKSNILSRYKLSGTQIFKYALIGVFSNLCGYGVYLALTELGMTPKFTMSMLYAVGASVGFYLNRRVTFSYQGGMLGAGGRFILAHIGGYTINFLLLSLLVDQLGYPHQWVQALAILLVAGYLFLTLKFFVFKAVP